MTAPLDAPAVIALGAVRTVGGDPLFSAPGLRSARLVSERWERSAIRRVELADPALGGLEIGPSGWRPRLADALGVAPGSRGFVRDACVLGRLARLDALDLRLARASFVQAGLGLIEDGLGREARAALTAFAAAETVRLSNIVGPGSQEAERFAAILMSDTAPARLADLGRALGLSEAENADGVRAWSDLVYCKWLLADAARSLIVRLTRLDAGRGAGGSGEAMTADLRMQWAAAQDLTRRADEDAERFAAADPAALRRLVLEAPARLAALGARSGALIEWASVRKRAQDPARQG